MTRHLSQSILLPSECIAPFTMTMPRPAKISGGLPNRTHTPVVSLIELVIFVLVCTSITLKAEGKPFIGVNYGGLGQSSHPLSYKVAIQKMKAAGVTAVKLFDTYPGFLDAAAGSGLQIVAAVPNFDLQTFAGSKSAAATWVTSNIVPHVSKVKIIAIAVGNEVLYAGGPLNNYLVPAMTNVHAALVSHGLQKSIKVVSPSSLSVIQGFKYDPPSQATFEVSVKSNVAALLSFLKTTGSDFFVNVYPYFNAIYDPNAKIKFLLFDGYNGYYDGKHYYQNQHDSMIDACISSMKKIGFTNIPVVIGESGWPTAGGAYASVENARNYNTRMVGRWLSNVGTPLRRNTQIKGYLFEFFDEDLKANTAGTVEVHWGVKTMSGTNKYFFSFTAGSTPLISPPTSTPVPSPSSSWCVAKPSYASNTAAVQSGLDWACGPGGVDCSVVQPGAACYGPGNLAYISSYVYNSYFQKSGQSAGSCNFAGSAVEVTSAPTLGGCSFPSSNGRWCLSTLGVVQEGLDYACSQKGVSCAAINPGGKCYDPNNLLAHASYAYNAYYKLHNKKGAGCRFGGAAQVVKKSPSSYSACI
eukprot:TRINITY_DN1206_c0_g1_i2.p1 TRINITY_DN1206_c0_g1~~TRINITY_DN1206_c0_g1_i2.p1  ORF type:complete len:582 (-),score=81.07 TRINITY_DN1206_c0_g1_i2:354-2099(-)